MSIPTQYPPVTIVDPPYEYNPQSQPIPSQPVTYPEFESIYEKDRETTYHVPPTSVPDGGVMSNPYARAAYSNLQVLPRQPVTGVPGATSVPPNTTAASNTGRQPSGVRSDGYTGEDYGSEIKGQFADLGDSVREELNGLFSIFSPKKKRGAERK